MMCLLSGRARTLLPGLQMVFPRIRNLQFVHVQFSLYIHINLASQDEAINIQKLNLGGNVGDHSTHFHDMHVYIDSRSTCIVKNVELHVRSG